MPVNKYFRDHYNCILAGQEFNHSNIDPHEIKQAIR
jgi:hypothetical protein